MSSTSTMDVKPETEQQPEDGQTKCPRISLKEIIAMVSILLACISCYYTQDIPGSLQDALMKYFDLSAYYYALFYSALALPSSVFTVVSGYMIDSSFGKRKTTYLFLAAMVIGSILFAVGAQINSYSVMVIARFLYGCGETTVLGSVVFYYTVVWFKDTYASLMFSLSDNLGTVGTLLVYTFSNKLMLFISDYHPDKQALVKTVIITSSVVMITVITVIIFTSMKPEHPEKVTSGKRGQIKDCLKFPVSFWILGFTYSTVANAVFVFEQFSQVMLATEFGLTVDEANEPITVMNLTKIVLAFPGGILISRLGRNLVFFIASIMLPLLSHIILLLKVNPNICLFILGIGYSFTAASLWPMYAWILNESNYGLGSGITNSLICITSFVYSLLAGKIIDTYGYIWVQIYFIILLLLGLIALLCLRIIDQKNAILLNMTPSERKTYEQTMISSTSTDQLSTDVMSQEKTYGSVNNKD